MSKGMPVPPDTIADVATARSVQGMAPPHPYYGGTLTLACAPAKTDGPHRGGNGRYRRSLRFALACPTLPGATDLG